MASENVDWADAAADVYTYFNERSRTFDVKRMLSVVDDCALAGRISQTTLVEKFKSKDFIATVLGHVTTAIHGKGVVPTGGWYFASGSPPLYTIDEGFAGAWKAKRRLSQTP